MDQILQDTLNLLERTAQFIETHRWSKSGPGCDLYSKEPCYCLEEALAVCAGRLPGQWGKKSEMGFPEAIAFEALTEENGGGEPWTFNDAAGRDKRKVVRYVRRTARKLHAGLIKPEILYGIAA